MSAVDGVSRREMIAGSAAVFGATAIGWPFAASAGELILSDDDSRSTLALYDLANFGPAGTRAAKSAFRFPADAADGVYGIDVSHHNGVVPWSALKGARVRFVYIKSSQSDNARDATFEDHWRSARALQSIPLGGYHFMTASVSGVSQGKFFADRLKRMGLAKGDLQPVIDLEWDFLGKDFVRTKIGTREDAGKIVNIYKDYWSDMLARDIKTTITDAVRTIKKEFSPLNVQPIVYTNASWWSETIKGVVIEDCKIWISDYRDASYENQTPRSVPRQTNNLWQFTEKGAIKAPDGKTYGVDCNKIVSGTMNDLVIA